MSNPNNPRGGQGKGQQGQVKGKGKNEGTIKFSVPKIVLPEPTAEEIAKFNKTLKKRIEIRSSADPNTAVQQWFNGLDELKRNTLIQKATALEEAALLDLFKKLALKADDTGRTALVKSQGLFSDETVIEKLWVNVQLCLGYLANGNPPVAYIAKDASGNVITDATTKKTAWQKTVEEFTAWCNTNEPNKLLVCKLVANSETLACLTNLVNAIVLPADARKHLGRSI